MSAMSRDLGVNRVTLYRWVGSREQLLVELIWSFSAKTLSDLDRRCDESGGERIVRVITGFLDAVITSPGMRHWLATEGESAMRLLTRYETDFQPRLVGWIEDALKQEAAAGTMDLPAPLSEVAFVVEQLIESYVYLDLITGEEPEAHRAEPILRMLLVR
jgi:AcrR family transcriptional regulator